jgi:hypothetical protein
MMEWHDIKEEYHYKRWKDIKEFMSNEIRGMVFYNVGPHL